MPSVIIPHPKSIAVVGGGTAGIAMLKALADVPEHTRRNWTIDLFEKREDLGGIWYAVLPRVASTRHADDPRSRLPDEAPRTPPTLPFTPLYPAMRTNNPHPQSRVLSSSLHDKAANRPASLSDVPARPVPGRHEPVPAACASSGAAHALC